MTAQNPNRVSPLLLGALTILASALMVYWGIVLTKEFTAQNARTNLLAAIENGEISMALDSIEKIDPLGTSTIGKWLSLDLAGVAKPPLAPVSDPSQPGFTWLFEQWRQQGHLADPNRLFEAAYRSNPELTLDEVAVHLAWLLEKQQHDLVFELLEIWLRRQLEFAVKPSDPTNSVNLLKLAETDSKWALRAWEIHQASACKSPLPVKLQEKALSTSSFGDPMIFERVLNLGGMLEPVDHFRILNVPNQLASPWSGASSGQEVSWVEYIAGVLTREQDKNIIAGKKEITEGRWAKSGPELPGLFLLRQILDATPPKHRAEIKPNQIEQALPVLDKMPEASKRTYARILDQCVFSISKHTKLQNWVWTNLRPSWNDQRLEFLAMAQIEATPFVSPYPDSLHDWVVTAIRHRQADLAAEVLTHLWLINSSNPQQTPPRLRRGYSTPFSPDVWGFGHPFAFTNLHFWAPNGESIASDSAALLLALGRNRVIPPTGEFPSVEQLSHGYSAQRPFEGWRPIWESASAEQLNEWLTSMGSNFEIDPFRSLLLPCFRTLAQTPFADKALRDPAKITRLQELASANEHRGGWLAKDLAEWAPQFWIPSNENREEFVRRGGKFETHRAESYLDDSALPVATRVSLALGLMDWEGITFLRRTEFEGSFYPAVVKLAVQFAKEIEVGRCNLAHLEPATLKVITDVWLGESFPLGGADLANERQNARSLLINAFAKIVLPLLKSVPTNQKDDVSDEFIILTFRRFFMAYSNLLRHDSRRAELEQFWKDVGTRFKIPADVVFWIAAHPGAANETTAKPFTSQIARDFAISGWRKIDRTLAEYDRTHTASILSAMTEDLELNDLATFFHGVLERMPAGFDAAPFYVIPPLTTPSLEERHSILIDGLESARSTEDYAELLSLSLPKLLGAFDADTRLPEPRHLKALQNERLPLAERWSAANFLMEETAFQQGKFENWKGDQKKLIETSVDLLLKCAVCELPLWEILQRGSKKEHIRAIVLDGFAFLMAEDPAEQSGRAQAIISPLIVDALRCDNFVFMEVLSHLFRIAIHNRDLDRSLTLYFSGINHKFYHTVGGRSGFEDGLTSKEREVAIGFLKQSLEELPDSAEPTLSEKILRVIEDLNKR